MTRAEIDQLKAAVNLRAVAAELGIMQSGGRWFCPTCQPAGGKSPDLAIFDQFFKCYKCGKGGDIFALVELSGVASDFGQALEYVATMTGKDRVKAEKSTEKSTEKRPAKIDLKKSTIREIYREKSGNPGPGSMSEKIVDCRRSWSEIFAAFLAACGPVDGQTLAWIVKGKKLDPAIVDRAGLRVCGRDYVNIMTGLESRFGKDQVKAAGLWSFYAYYKADIEFLVIPYYQDGAPVYLKARPPLSADLADKYQIDRFRNTAGRVPCLYGVDLLKNRPDKVLICEGESDTWAAWTWQENAVGSPGGKAFKPAWVDHFRSIPWVYLVQDNDQAGAESTRIIADLFLSAGLPCPLLVKIPGEFKDLGDYLKGGYKTGDSGPEISEAKQ